MVHHLVGDCRRWFDELIVHRGNRVVPLAANAVWTTSSLDHVAFETPGIPNVLGGRSEHPVVETFDQLGKSEQQDALGDDHIGGGKNDEVVGALVAIEVVDGHTYVEAFDQTIEVMAEQIGVERVRVVEVDQGPFVDRQRPKVLVIRVEREDRNVVLADRGGQLVRESRLA